MVMAMTKPMLLSARSSWQNSAPIRDAARGAHARQHERAPCSAHTCMQSDRIHAQAMAIGRELPGQPMAEQEGCEFIKQ